MIPGEPHQDHPDQAKEQGKHAAPAGQQRMARREGPDLHDGGEKEEDCKNQRGRQQKPGESGRHPLHCGTGIIGIIMPEQIYCHAAGHMHAAAAESQTAEDPRAIGM